MILLDSVTKLYPGDEEPALNEVSLHIEPHEFVFLVGKSGAGKSTLIKMITKEERPDSGRIVIGGIDLAFVKKRHIPHYRRRLGVVFQDYKLLPTRTVFENVAFALEIAGMSNSEIIETVPRVLDLVGLGDKAHKFPAHLSGGEQQRVSIARSVARQPKILIADEPTGNLDKLTRQEIIELLQKINDFGTTVLVTTHDETIVNNLSKRVITLQAGKIVNDQKNHGIYRLEAAPKEESSRQHIRSEEIRESKPKHSEVREPALSPRAGRLAKLREKLPPVEHRPLHAAAPERPRTVPKIRAIRAPGAALAAQKPATPNATKAKVGLANTKLAPSHRPKTNAPKDLSSARHKMPEKAPLSPLSTGLSRTSTPARPPRDSANQWYTASQPLRTAPKLSNLTLGQTVQLRPAPSSLTSQTPQPHLARKKVGKRVI